MGGISNQRWRFRGFTLVELAVSMVVLGLIAIVMIALVPKLTERIRLDSTTTELGDVRESIIGFVVEESRLPCPDVNGDGLEGTVGVCDPADQVGNIPFRSLGLPGPVIDEARLPLRYGVYRNSGDDADLVTLTNLFEPNIPGPLDITIGTVSGCGQILDGVVQITYSNPSENILTVNNSTGSFDVDDVVSGSRLDYGTVVANGTIEDFVAGEEINLAGLAPVAHCSFDTGTSCESDSDCPFSGLGEECIFEPPTQSCSISGTSCTTASDCPQRCALTQGTTCTADTDCPFIPGTTTNESCIALETCDIGDHRVCDGDPIDQTCVVDSDCPGAESCIALPPSAVVDSVVDLGPPNPEGDRLILPDPTGEFQVGDTIVGLTSGVTATVTDFYFPGSATITSIITPGLVFGVTLTPTGSRFVPPDFGFETNQLLFAKPGDGRANFVSLQKDTQLMFQVGETVTGQTSGATGTIDADNGTIMTVSNVSGTFIGPSPPGTDPPDYTPGEVITGGTSGASSEIVSVGTDVYATPNVTVGSNPIPDPNVTVSGELNQLDMCKNLRNGIQDGFGTEQVHTVNGTSVVINPAYLMVSGGVEDAIPGGVAFDGLNAGIVSLDFDSPAKGRNANYDDLVNTASMSYLYERLACPRTLGTVNAMANTAMVAQNIAISSFNNNENALQAILDTWAGLKLAEANVALELFGTLIAAAECAKATTTAIKLGGVTAAEVAVACAAAVVAVVNFAFAVDALNTAEEFYKFSCEDQIVASGELSNSIAAAAAALIRAQEADVKAGVK